MPRRTATAFRTREGRSVRILPELHDLLKARAQEEGVTLTELIHELLSQAIERPDLVPRLALAKSA